MPMPMPGPDHTTSSDLTVPTGIWHEHLPLGSQLMHLEIQKKDALAFLQRQFLLQHATLRVTCTRYDKLAVTIAPPSTAPSGLRGLRGLTRRGASGAVAACGGVTDGPAAAAAARGRGRGAPCNAPTVAVRARPPAPSRLSEAICAS
jgi:hypothetical protein